MSIYLKKFENHTQYEQYINGSGAILPNVSICTTEGDVHYNPEIPHDYSQDYFTMVITSGGNIKWSGSTAFNTLSYSKNNGDNWTTANSATTISVAEGDKVLWKGTPTPQRNKGVGKFTGDTNARYSVEGNAMSLLYGDNFNGQTSLSGKDFALYGLFSGNTNVTNTENLSLHATTLASYCYNSMFQECTSLTTAPELSATTLADFCYGNMFFGCTSLTIAPSVLPATTLANGCYQHMLHGCTSLTTAPELSATTLANYCYYGMFKGCTSLTTAPELPATTLAIFCYENMFQGCTSLTTAPELPATTLERECYRGMFSGCTSLTTVPSVLPATNLSGAYNCYRDMFYGCTSLATAPTLPATTLAYYCYMSMFRECSSLTTAPELPATTLVIQCYEDMFFSCTSLNSIKCLATDISAIDSTSGWVSNVASSGTFTKPESMTSWTTGNNGIPNGWTVVDAA